MPRSLDSIRRRSVDPLFSFGVAVRSGPAAWIMPLGALALRLYLAPLWFRFGLTKLEAEWLTTNPVRGLLTLVASGQTPMPVRGLSVVADVLLAMRADTMLSVMLPLVEIALGAAFLTGILVRVAAVGGIAVNTSLILGGLASVAFDGRIILLQALLLLAGGRAGSLGVPALLRLGRRRGARRAAPLVPRDARSEVEAVRKSSNGRFTIARVRSAVEGARPVRAARRHDERRGAVARRPAAYW